MSRYVFRLFLDFEKEEAWLNEMARQGWMLDGYYFIVQRFVRCDPGQYVYREALLPHRAGSPENQAYLDFVKDADIEVAARWGMWVIYRRQAGDDGFEVYSDTESRIAHYRHVSRLTLLCCALELLIIAFLLSVSVIEHGAIDLSWPELLLISAVFLIGLALFAIGWRFRRKFRRLLREQRLLE